MSAIFKKNIFWKTSGFVWSVGYFIFILITGGVDSSFIFLSLLIPVISLFELDSRATRNVSIFMTLLLFLVIFFEPNHLNNFSIWTKHLLNVFGVGFGSFLVYRFVKGTIREKSEKEQIKRRFLELNEIDHTKQVFLSAMSHQLRTPLNGVRWAFESIINDPRNMKGGEMCIDENLIKEGYGRVLESIEIIGKILQTAELEIDRKNIELKKEKLNLKKLLDSIFVNLDYMIRSRVIDLVKEKYEDVIIEGDSKMLDLALTNVIDNAFRYSPNGRVTVCLYAKKEQAVLTIEDNGIGIDSAEAEFIFQKFYRGKNAMLVDPDESGIGLYTTKKIIELHNGRITLLSVLNKGTKVSIVLPLTKIS
jgi:signal transduction histidine kinase